MAKYAPRDSQRTKVYRHEWALERAVPAFAENMDSFEDVIGLVHLAYDMYGIPERVPTVVKNPLRTSTCVFHHGRGDGYGQIEMGTGGNAKRYHLSARIALHEAAHGIMFATGLMPHYASHGPEFVGITHRLYNSVLGVPDDVLAAFARRSGARRVSPQFDPLAHGEKIGSLWNVTFRSCKSDPFSVPVAASSKDAARRYVCRFGIASAAILQIDPITVPF